MKQQILPQAISWGLLGLALSSAVLTAFGGNAMAQNQPQNQPVWYNCLTREVFTPQKQAWCDRWQTLQNATYIVPTSLAESPEYTSVRLEAGRYQFAGSQTQVELVNEPGWLAFGDLDGDGKTDAAVIFGLALDPDGAAVGTYLSTVLDIDGAARALNPVKLGERIALNSPIAIADQRVVVPVLSAQAVTHRAFVTDGSSLSELAQLPGPDLSSQALADGTLVFAQTPGYAVRVFNQGGQSRINLFNKTTRQAELSGAIALVESTPEGATYSAQSAAVSVQVVVDSAGRQRLTVNGQRLQGAAEVSGRVTYRQRSALPPNAVLEVALVDVSRADAPAVVLASQAIVTAGRQVPLPFALTYDPGQIDARLTYAVQARITIDGQLRFINPSQVPVITQGRPSAVEIEVEPVSP